MLEHLNSCRADTVKNLMFIYDVSKRTVLRDIEYLSLSFPINTKQGNCGCVYVEEWFDLHRHYLNTEQQETLKKVIENCSEKDAAVLSSILITFSRNIKVKQ